jgi:hypothetical protein
MQAHAEGCELLGTITVSNGQLHGTVLFQKNIGPQFLNATRIQAYAALFEKYRYTHARLVLRSKCSNSTNGSVIAFFERDVSEPAPNANSESAQRSAQAWGAADIPVKTDGQAVMRKITDENPYFTDMGASPSDPAFGQAMAYIQLNSTGSSVTSTSLTTHDVLLEYKCMFWVPQLQSENLLFYTFVQPTGAGGTTTDLLGTVASIEPGGNLEGVTFNGTNTVTLAARYSHYYTVQYIVDGTTIAGAAVTLGSNTTADESSTAAASSTSNIVEKTFHLTNPNQGLVQNVSLTLACTTMTTPTFICFKVLDFGSGFNPANPVAGPSGEVSTSKWSRRRKDKDLIRDIEHDKRMNALEKQLAAFRKQLSFIQEKKSTIEFDSEPEEDFIVTPAQEGQSSTFSPVPYDPCFYCRIENPDHPGSKCPQRTKRTRSADNNNRRS